MNGGSCVGNSTHFRCECTPGYTGPLCQHSLNECESSPCIHGICVDQEDGFRCFCQPGNVKQELRVDDVSGEMDKKILK
ncbi:protein jagged-1-like [Lucilia cuprina]|uniref:protein jagged-1-like n=1 Tax=Lucilia cuprina TaxID=7375 RepID=UPI001F062A99|nr:protein jagged-1-like [Lucilia cuprina]